MGNAIELSFYDSWMWLIFIGIGLLLVLVELLLGVDTGLDLVFMGSAFILGGLITWVFHSWVVTLAVTLVICILYIVLGRGYIHRRTAVKKTATNIDAIIGRNALVLKTLASPKEAMVRVGNEEWRARATEELEAGEEVVVTGIQGVTLIIEKNKEEK